GTGCVRGRDRRADRAGHARGRQRRPAAGADRRRRGRARLDPGRLRGVAGHRRGAVAPDLARAAARRPAGGARRALPRRGDGADPARAPRGALRPMTRRGLAARLAVLAVLLAAPAVLDTYNTFLLTEILIFGLFAASLDLLIGYSGMPSLGHGGYYGVGA